MAFFSQARQEGPGTMGLPACHAANFAQCRSGRFRHGCDDGCGFYQWRRLVLSRLVELCVPRTSIGRHQSFLLGR